MSKIIKSKILAGFLALAMVVFAAPSFGQAAVIGNLNLTGTTSQGGTVNLTGTCATSGNISLSLVDTSGNVTNLGTISGNTGAVNSFGTSVVIPSTYNTGSSTLVATCANGDTLTVPVTVSAATPAVNTNTGATLNLTGTPVQGAGSFNVSGACGTSGTVTFSLVNNGVTTNIGSAVATTGTTNSFNTNLSIPSTYATGSSTLVATCPNGSTLTLPVNILAPSSDLLRLNIGTPAINGTVNVSGVCGSGANGSNVNFSLERNGVVTNLASTTTANGANGAFNTTVTIPSTYGDGLATLIANCGNGDVVSSLVVIGDPATLGLTFNPATPVVNGSVTVSGVCPTASTSVSFTGVQNGTTVNLGTGNYALNGNGTFAVTLPLSGLAAGAANIAATCNNNGGTITTGVVLTSAGSVQMPGDVAGVATPPAGQVAGVATTPVGGVAAGNGGSADATTVMMFFLLTSLVAAGLLIGAEKLQRKA